MNRFASLATTAALVGCLLRAETNAQAASAMYLVPISDISATYAPGAYVKFAVVLDLGISTFRSFAVPAAAAYTITQFGPARPTAQYDTTEDPLLPGSGIPLWNLNDNVVYRTTASTIHGARVYTILPDVGHVAVIGSDGITALPVPAGTYTIATFTFPISPAVSDRAVSVYLPTPYGFSNAANSTDGAYQSGFGPLNAILGRNVALANISDPLTFPNANGKYSALTFNVSAVPEPGSLALLVSIAPVSIVVLRKRRKG